MDSIESMITRWEKLSANLALVKAEEMELRQKIAGNILKDKTKGSKTIPVGQFKLTATAKLNSKINLEELRAIWKDLNEEEKQVFKFSPKLVSEKYKQLPDNSIVHKVITNTPGSHGLSIKEIK